MEHTYTAVTPQGSPSLARNPKLKPKQGKVILPHLKGDIPGTSIFLTLSKPIILFCLDPSKRQPGITPLNNNGTSSKPLLLTTIPLISTTDPFQKGMGMKVTVSSQAVLFPLMDITIYSPRHLILLLILIDRLTMMPQTSHWSNIFCNIINNNIAQYYMQCNLYNFLYL